MAVLGLVGGAVLDIYSSGLSLLTAGVPVPRFLAAGIDGVVMIAGAVYIVFFSADFLGPFQGFLITLGVPIAAWCGVMLADVALRRGDYAEADLFDARRPLRRRPCAAGGADGHRRGGRLGAGHERLGGLAGLAGLPARPVGSAAVRAPGRYANLGVLAALLIGFLGIFIFGRQSIRAQEEQPV